MTGGMTDLDEVRSVRADGDSWSITESVGATALSVAAARAVETAAAQPLIRDEFASVLVASAGAAWARLASPDLEWISDDEHGRRAHRVTCDYQAVRTHFFDEYFRAAMASGIRQAVILAAGLDSRAYRLDWPADTTVYEIDQPKVLEYKSRTLEAHHAVPKATRRAVAVEYVQQDTAKTMRDVELRDRDARAARNAEMRRIASDPQAARAYLIRSSMIASVNETRLRTA